MAVDLEHLLREAAATPRAVVDVAALLRVEQRRRGRRRITGALGAAVLVGLLTLGAGALPGGGLRFGGPGVSRAVLPLPEPGEARAEWLADGTPVFVTRDRHGEQAVHVVRARESWRGMDVAVLWCGSTRALTGVWTGSRFAPDGRWAGGPASQGLATYEATVRNGQVHVGGRREPAFRDPEPPSVSPGVHCDEPPGARGRDVLDHGLPRLPRTTVAEVLRARPFDPVLVEAVLVQEEDGRVFLCDGFDAEAVRCAGERVLLGERGEPTDHRFAVHALVHGRLRQDRLEHALLVAVLREMGSIDLSSRVPGAGGREPTVGSGRLVFVRAQDLGYPDPPHTLPPGEWTFRLVNEGAVQHSLVWEDHDWRLHAPADRADEATITLGAGTHVFYCEIPGHRQAGMEFRLEVS